MDYGGEISPSETYDKIAGSGAVLVDVRTQAEWTYVGLPALPADAHQPVLQQWQIFPSMAVDTEFVPGLEAQLDNLGVGKETELCFLCRTGVRSLAAAKATTAAGYAHCLNITDGFEGDRDENGHRGTKNGWKADGLPWSQG